MKRIRERCQRISFELKASLQEAFEDPLRVALIRSGDPVNIRRKRLYMKDRAIRVEPRINTSLVLNDQYMGFFCFNFTMEKFLAW